MKNSVKPFFALLLLISLLWALWWLFGILYGASNETLIGQFDDNPYIASESGTFFEEKGQQIIPTSNIGAKEGVIESIEKETFVERYAFKESLEVVAQTLDRINVREIEDPLSKDPDTLPASNFPDYYLDGREDVRKLLLIKEAFEERPPLPAGLSINDPDILEKLYIHLLESGHIDEGNLPIETEGDVFRLNQEEFEYLDDLGMYDSPQSHEGERERARRAVYETSIEAWRGEEIFRGQGNFLNYRDNAKSVSLEFLTEIGRSVATVISPKTANAYSDLIDNFVTIPDCWKSVPPTDPGARIERGMEGGENIYAPCCNCGIYYGGGYDIEFVYDCGTYDDLDFPINEDCNVLPLGCINLVCFGEEANAIFDGPPGYRVPATAGFGGGFNVNWSFTCGCDSDIKLGPKATNAES